MRRLSLHHNLLTEFDLSQVKGLKKLHELDLRHNVIDRLISQVEVNLFNYNIHCGSQTKSITLKHKFCFADAKCGRVAGQPCANGVASWAQQADHLGRFSARAEKSQNFGPQSQRDALPAPRWARWLGQSKAFGHQPQSDLNIGRYFKGDNCNKLKLKKIKPKMKTYFSAETAAITGDSSCRTQPAHTLGQRPPWIPQNLCGRVLSQQHRSYQYSDCNQEFLRSQRCYFNSKNIPRR